MDDPAIFAGQLAAEPELAIGRRFTATLRLDELQRADRAHVARIFANAYRAVWVEPDEFPRLTVGHRSAKRFMIPVFETPQNAVFHVLELDLSLDGRCCCCLDALFCRCPSSIIKEYRPTRRVRPRDGLPARNSGLIWNEAEQTLTLNFHVTNALRVGDLPAHRTLMLTVSLFDGLYRYRPYSWSTLVRVIARNQPYAARA